jgi:hypothetical protein
VPQTSDVHTIDPDVSRINVTYGLSTSFCACAGDVNNAKSVAAPSHARNVRMARMVSRACE